MLQKVHPSDRNQLHQDLKHADRPMKVMAELIRQGKPAEEVMNIRELKTKKNENMAVKTGRNDPCFCGSGLKFKKCHGK
jgi:uncharacterized protein